MHVRITSAQITHEMKMDENYYVPLPIFMIDNTASFP